MDARSTYDDTNEVWPYFVLTLFLALLVPVTVSEVLLQLRKPREGAPKAFAHFLKRYRRRTASKRCRPFLLALGWLVFAVFVKYMQSIVGAGEEKGESALWDPYEILKVARNAPMKEIKRAYRMLSLEFHPDKAKEGTREQIEAVYVEISKAYRALTDEVTRENFLLHGHPDGPQPVKHGIALPAFLFNPAASAMYILAYLLLFGVGVPVFVQLWWARSRRRTRGGLLQATATQFCSMLAKEQPHFIQAQHIVEEVLKCEDITTSLKLFGAGNLSIEERRELLQEYLTRGPKSEEDLPLLLAVEVARVLLALHSIAVYFKSFELCARIMTLHRAVVQAVPFNDVAFGEYLQLAGADYKKFVSAMTSGDKSEAKKVQEEAQKVLVGARSYLPRLALLSAQFRVRGEENITTNSQVFLELKFIVVPVGESVPQLSKEELDALKNAEKRAESAASKSAGKGGSAANAMANFKKYISSLNQQQPEVGPARAPRFPLTVQTSWVVYIFGMIDNKLVEDPFEIHNLNLHNLTLSSAQLKSGDGLVIGTAYVPLSSASPPQPVMATFKVAMLSTAYFGTDLRTIVNMQVVDAAPVVVEEDDESSDEEIEGLSDIDTDTDAEVEA